MAPSTPASGQFSRKRSLTDGQESRTSEATEEMGSNKKARRDDGQLHEDILAIHGFIRRKEFRQIFGGRPKTAASKTPSKVVRVRCGTCTRKDGTIIDAFMFPAALKRGESTQTVCFEAHDPALSTGRRALSPKDIEFTKYLMFGIWHCERESRKFRSVETDKKEANKLWRGFLLAAYDNVISGKPIKLEQAGLLDVQPRRADRKKRIARSASQHEQAFLATYPDLIDDRSVWAAFENDGTDFDLDDEVVRMRIIDACVAIFQLQGGDGPSVDILKAAREEARRGDTPLSKTKVFQKWKFTKIDRMPSAAVVQYKDSPHALQILYKKHGAGSVTGDWAARALRPYGEVAAGLWTPKKEVRQATEPAKPSMAQCIAAFQYNPASGSGEQMVVGESKACKEHLMCRGLSRCLEKIRAPK